MKGQFNLQTIDKILNNFGILNVLLNWILIMLIPQSEAIACTATPYKELDALCDPYWWYCDTTTECQLFEKHLTRYWLNASKTGSSCTICDCWVNTRQICSPCMA
jgi:hypothetical protein